MAPASNNTSGSTATLSSLLPLLLVVVLSLVQAAAAWAEFDYTILASPKRSPPPPPAPGMRTPPPPPRRPVGRRTVKCTRRQFPKCFLIKALCPLECRTNCFMDCTLCKPVCHCDRPGAICQDPRFIGGDGITFYFHGRRNSDFCLVTQPDLHINAHFIGKRVPGRSRDFTWVQSIGILFAGHRLLVGARKTAVWDDATDRLELAFDGEPVELPPKQGAKWQCKYEPHISVTRTRDANGVSVEAAGHFAISTVVIPITKEDSKLHGYDITDEDCFAHLDLGFKFHCLSDDVGGVLGQTYRKNYTSKVRMGVSMPVLGGEREFATSGIFSPDCIASRFRVS
ncbi:hypothetical protein Taro_046929 [Colocasia esculenta]|uniref:Uncharacterized protein n=1 Tax=Colocasia esculenta TaxID=4460 RepID=A0A843X4S8_COLES|nr:hypothetical protein [Colocasia esculenta]